MKRKSRGLVAPRDARAKEERGDPAATGGDAITTLAKSTSKRNKGEGGGAPSSLSLSPSLCLSLSRARTPSLAACYFSILPRRVDTRPRAGRETRYRRADRGGPRRDPLMARWFSESRKGDSRERRSTSEWCLAVATRQFQRAPQSGRLHAARAPANYPRFCVRARAQRRRGVGLPLPRCFRETAYDSETRYFPPPLV